MLIKFAKEISHKILYNDLTHFYSSKYITYKNLRNKFFIKKKIFEKEDYVYFLYKQLNKFNIKKRILRKIFIYIYTIIYELSADCSFRNIEISIENKVKKLSIGSLNEILKRTLPSGAFNIKLKDINNSLIIFDNYKTSNGIYKIIISEKKNNAKKKCNFFYNIIVSLKKNSIIKVKKNKLFKSSFIAKDHIHKINDAYYENYHHKIIGTSNEIKSYTQIPNLNYEQYKIIKEKFFLCKYKHITSIKKFEIIKKEKKYSNSRDYNKILDIKDAIISFRGLISFDKFTIRESISHSIWDPIFKTKNNRILIPKITKKIYGNAIIFPTAHSSLGHYAFESFIRLYYLRKIEKFKIIVYESIPNYLLEILLKLGVKKEQILKKKFNESWQIQRLLYPIIPLFEVSKNEADFLGSLININNNKRLKTFDVQNHDKIYISRTDARENRNLINEEEIENFLRLNGFKIIIASKLNIEEKIKIFSNAKIIVTPLGSGMHNFIFCKKIPAKVIVIGTKYYFNRDYIQYAFLKKLNLYFLEAIEIPSYSAGAWQYLHSSFFLNPIILEKTLKIL